MTGDAALAEAVASDWSKADLAPRERALLAYAMKVTLAPATLGPGDLAPLRAEGLSDRAILDATHVIGFFNHINRLADALGVDTEPEMPPDPRRTG